MTSGDPTVPEPSVPPWITAALALEPDTGEVDVDGGRVRWRSWGAPDRPSVVLVHGGAAHAGWWRVIAPSFLPDHRVVAVDLTGHGASGRRRAYAFPTWADEVIAVADAAGARDPVVVGHSMGGVVAAVAAARTELAGVVLVDAPLHPPQQRAIANAEEIFRRVRSYPSRGAALDRFRLLPDQPVLHPALLTTVAEESIEPVDGGWSWRFDPAVFARAATDRPDDVGAVLEEVRCPVGAVVGARSGVVPPADRGRLEQLAARTVPDGSSYVEVADGYHHLMFDRPLELVAAVRAIIGAWSATPTIS